MIRKIREVSIFGDKLIAIGSVINAAERELKECEIILGAETMDEIRQALQKAMQPIIQKNAHL